MNRVITKVTADNLVTAEVDDKRIENGSSGIRQVGGQKG